MNLIIILIPVIFYDTSTSYNAFLSNRIKLKKVQLNFANYIAHILGHSMTRLNYWLME